MRSNDERLQNIFQKAKEKKRRKKMWVRTAVITTVCLLCTVTGVAVVLSDQNHTITVTQQTNSNSPTSIRPNSHPADPSDPQPTETGQAGEAIETAPGDSSAGGQKNPELNDPASEGSNLPAPTEPSLGDTPQDSDPTQPAATEPAADPTDPGNDASEPINSPVEPPTIPVENPVATETPTLDEQKHTTPQLGTQATDPEDLSPSQKPSVKYYDSRYETAVIHSFTSTDITEDHDFLLGLKNRQILISDSLAEKAEESSSDRVLRTKIYAKSKYVEDILAFFSAHTVSYTLSGNSYLVYMTGEQLQNIGNHPVPEDFYLLITEG